MKKLIIYGASGHGKVCANIARKMNKWAEILFCDDFKKGTLSGHTIIDVSDIKIYIKKNDNFFIAIGDNTNRMKITKKLNELAADIVTLVDGSSIVGDGVELGLGTVLMPNSVVNASSKIGAGTIVNTSAIVEHDCAIGDFVHLSPGTVIAGGTKIGDECWIGLNATIINNLSITNNVIIGAGSVVLKDISESGKYVGSPVRSIFDTR